MARLSQMGEQRIVAGILAMVRVEAPERPGDRGAGPHDRAIDVDGQPRQLQPSDGVGDELVVELDQRSQGRGRELPQPIAHRASRRDPGQPTEAGDQRIASDIPEMLQPAGADVEQRQHQQRQSSAAVIAACGGEGGAQSAGQFPLPQIAAEHFQPAVRRQLLAHELDVQLSLDHSSQARYAQTHQSGLLCAGSDMGMSSPLNNAQEAVLFQRIPSPFTAQLFSDWG